MPLQNWTAPSVVWLTENWSLPYGLIGRLCSVPIQEDLACSWAAVYLWMAVRSLWTGRSSSSFLLGSTYLVNLSSLHLHPWYGLPLPWAFKVWHKKSQGGSLHTQTKTYRKLPFQLHCFQGFLSFPPRHQLQLFSILRGFYFFNWVLLLYLIWMLSRSCWEGRNFSHTD